MTFASWLKEQKNRDDIIGDLAVDFSADKSKVRTYAGLRKRMSSLNACDEAIEALDAAYDEWVSPFGIPRKDPLTRPSRSNYKAYVKQRKISQGPL